MLHEIHLYIQLCPRLGVRSLVATILILRVIRLARPMLMVMFCMMITMIILTTFRLPCGKEEQPALRATYSLNLTPGVRPLRLSVKQKIASGTI